MNKWTLFFFSFLGTFVSANPHKVIYLVSPPRSLSVGFTRMIEARGDFKIFHEPSVSVYHKAHNYTFSSEWFKEGAFQTFEEIKKAIFAGDSNVFVKEISFHLAEFLDEDLIKNPNVYFIFLLRDPHASVISLYLKIQPIAGNCANVDDWHLAVGYKSMVDIFQKIKAFGGRQPLILFSEELAAKPQEAIAKFCNYADIPLKEESLAWESLGNDFDAYTLWNENKRVDLIYHWHEDALQSTGFRPLKTYDKDNQGNPTFLEVKDPKDREECQKSYHYSLPYYQFFQSLETNPDY